MGASGHGQPLSFIQKWCLTLQSALAQETIEMILASRSSSYSAEDLAEVDARGGNRNSEKTMGMCQEDGQGVRGGLGGRVAAVWERTQGRRERVVI